MSRVFATTLIAIAAAALSLRAQSGVLEPDWDNTARTLAKIARSAPDELRLVPDATMLALTVRVHGRLRIEVLKAVHDAHWQPQTFGFDGDKLWLRLATDLIETGDLSGATSVARDISNYRELIEMHADKRFDAIVSADPARFDVATAIDRDLASRRADAAAFPTKLAAVNALAEALRKRNRAEEALAVVEAALAKVRDSDNSYFDDQADNLNFTLDDQSRALEDLGRVDESVGAQKLGAAQLENGRNNVSQVLNLAATLDDLGRPQDALAALQGFGSRPTSAYGAMVWREDLVCAYAQLGNQAKVAQSLNYMKAHADDGPTTLQYALSCAGDADGYARSLIDRLNDPETRGTVLLDLQDFLPRPSKGTAWQNTLKAFWRDVVQRPDVQTAVAKYGRVEHYPIMES